MGRPAPFFYVHPMAYVRSELGLTHRDLVTWLAGEIGMAARPEKSWRRENRGVIPEMDVQRALADRLSVPLRHLITQPWPHWLPCGDSVPVEADWTVEGCVQVLNKTVEMSTIDRRGFLMLSTGSAAALARTWATTGNPVRGSSAEQDVFVSSFESRLPALRAHEDREGGGGVTTALLDSELRTASTFLAGGPVKKASLVRVLRVVAELTRISGWAHVDIGAHAAAEKRFFAGLRAAHAIGDHSAGANLLKCVSLLLMEHGRGREAAEVARIAVERSCDAPGRVQAMLKVREARVLASLGESRACQSLLAQAETHMGEADGAEVPGWAEYFDAAEYHAQVASCYLGLEQYAMSDSHLEQALGLQPEERSRDGVTYLMWRAETAARLDEVDRACFHVEQALPQLSRVASHRNRSRLAQVKRLLGRHKTTPCVKELDEKVHGLVA